MCSIRDHGSDWELISMEHGEVESSSEVTGQDTWDVDPRVRRDSGTDSDGEASDASGLERASFQELQEGVIDLGHYHVNKLRDQVRDLKASLMEKDRMIQLLEEKVKCLEAEVAHAAG
ncbi:hypothetical protein AAF712_008996, partial [Marasmius tenuissimus]